MTLRLPSPARAAPPVQWLALIACSWAGAAILGAVGFPAAVLLAPALVATAFGVGGATIAVHAVPHRLAQGVAGVLIAQYLDSGMLASVAEHWLVFAVFSAVTLAVSAAVGWIAGRLTDMPREEAVWGFLPGMAASMIAMSHEQGLDSRYVAFLQFTRLLMVILVMTCVAALLVPGLAERMVPGSGIATDPGLAGVLVTLLAAGTALIADRVVPFLPGGQSLLPMAAAVLASSGLGLPLALPQWLLMVAFFVVGVDVGLRFQPALLRHVARILPAMVLASLVLMALCSVSGLILARLLGIPPLTAVLATVPGSVETVALIAIHTQSDVTFVMTLQVLRMAAVLLAGPVLARLICARLERPSGV